MQKLLEKLLVINEFDIKKALRTTAATGLIGGAAFGLGYQKGLSQKEVEKPVSVTKVEQPVKDMTIKKYFPEEYNSIKTAADRNNCTGEDLLILFAIRKAENGPKGLEFGVMHPKAKNTNLNIQAGWAAATIVKNRQRWEDAGKPEDFITFLGKKYAPVGVENDPEGLNVNWVKNVKYWIDRLKGL